MMNVGDTRTTKPLGIVQPGDDSVSTLGHDPEAMGGTHAIEPRTQHVTATLPVRRLPISHFFSRSRVVRVVLWVLIAVGVLEVVVGAVEFVVGLSLVQGLFFGVSVPPPPPGQSVLELPGLPAVVMIRGLVLGAVTFLIGAVLGHPTIRWLRSHRILKQVSQYESIGNIKKTGTPSMGGIIFLLPIVIVMLMFMDINSYRSLLLPLGVVIACGILGSVDDLMSTMDNNRGGMAVRVKMVGLLGIGVVAASVLYFPLGYHNVYLPFVARPIDMGWLYLPAAVIVMVGTANAVNLADGLDTLAGGTTAIAFVSYGIIAYLQRQPQVVLLCMVTVGGILAFLWFNAHPAQVFMGDVGALTLGALLGLCALMTNQWLLLPLIGLVFVLEALSDILQIGAVKLKRKLPFKKAPIHHHFHESGWAETQITVRFWLLAMIAGMLGVALAMV